MEHPPRRRPAATTTTVGRAQIVGENRELLRARTQKSVVEITLARRVLGAPTPHQYVKVGVYSLSFPANW
jgi:hypothetical protein